MMAPGEATHPPAWPLAPPRGVTGILRSPAKRRTAATSSVVLGSTTTSRDLRDAACCGDRRRGHSIEGRGGWRLPCPPPEGPPGLARAYPVTRGPLHEQPSSACSRDHSSVRVLGAAARPHYEERAGVKPAATPLQGPASWSILARSIRNAELCLPGFLSSPLTIFREHLGGECAHFVAGSSNCSEGRMTEL